MQHYRLLRNNKESGPYTWKELAHLPLKPYDLVWVDGKSAAWRYPSELPEFKELAPAVEEDFYRIFHKNPAEKNEEEIPSVISQPQKKEQYQQNPKKSITVILPEKASSSKREPVLQVAHLPEKKAELTPLIETPSKATELAADPVIDQIQFQPKPQLKNYLPAGFNRIAMAVLFAINLFFVIRYFNGRNIEFGSNEPGTILQTESPALIPAIQTNNEHSNEQDIPNSLPANPALEFAALRRHLSIRPDEINVGMFGGINHLVLTVKNSHSQPIEDIKIAVDFLEKDQTLHHSEMVIVEKIEASSSLSVKVPTNGKGRSVQTRIIGIGK
ncbi:hypothetical protein [Flavihumibacter sp. UBA7668]|uniref:hypothetical protein n=1 Tax=Flavihumibacter sp. UBA7668 TaxID=1946542 RepID=UPI0025BCC351|nr:hypothetical protein [Flavihumibacter sp. UBA7668]